MHRILVFVVVIMIICLHAIPVQAEKWVSQEIKVELLPQPDGSFSLVFHFATTKLPANIDIDYAVLTFTTQVVRSADRLGARRQIVLEVLNDAMPEDAPYNLHPVTSEISCESDGRRMVRLDIGELVMLDRNGGKMDHCVRVVSHRGLAESLLSTAVIDPATGFAPIAVEIYFTKME